MYIKFFVKENRISSSCEVKYKKQIEYFCTSKWFYFPKQFNIPKVNVWMWPI